MEKVLFGYPTKIYQRCHEPGGYVDYTSYKPWLRDEFTFRCVYCLTRETWGHRGDHSFSVEHLKPKKWHPHLENEYGNLVYACLACNTAKGGYDIDFEPCTKAFGEHLEIQSNGRLLAKTDDGLLAIEIFDLNNGRLVDFRKTLIETLSHASKNQNPEGQKMMDLWLRWPSELPDLARLAPPKNEKPAGIERSYNFIRSQKKLPALMIFPDGAPSIRT